ADALADAARHSPDVEAADPGRPRGGPQEGDEDANRGRLARAVGAQEAEDLAPFHGERDSVERGLSARVGLDQVLDLDSPGRGARGDRLHDETSLVSQGPPHCLQAHRGGPTYVE